MSFVQEDDPPLYVAMVVVLLGHADDFDYAFLRSLKMNETLHSKLTGEEREIVQEWLLKRYLQLQFPSQGRRAKDLVIRATMSPDQHARYTHWRRGGVSR